MPKKKKIKLTKEMRKKIMDFAVPWALGKAIMNIMEKIEREEKKEDEQARSK